MGKHSFRSNYRNLTPVTPEPKDSRFVPDHEPMEVYEINYTYSYGIFSETTTKSLSKRIAKWGLIPLAGSILIGILALFGIMLDDVFVKSVLILTWGFYLNAFLFYWEERRLRRNLLGLAKPKKRRLGLASLLGFPGFALIVGGLTSYPHLGIWNGILTFLGSVMTLVAFGLMNSSPKSEKKFGLREILMTLIFLPATIAFFAFFTIGIGFFFEYVFN